MGFFDDVGDFFGSAGETVGGFIGDSLDLLDISSIGPTGISFGRPGSSLPPIIIGQPTPQILPGAAPGVAVRPPTPVVVQPPPSPPPPPVDIAGAISSAISGITGIFDSQPQDAGSPGAQASFFGQAGIPLAVGVGLVAIVGLVLVLRK